MRVDVLSTEGKSAVRAQQRQVVPQRTEVTVCPLPLSANVRVHLKLMWSNGN